MECAFNLMLAAGISCSYVGLLYAFDFNGVDRNDPSSIKRRFFAAVVNNIIGILVTYILLHRVSVILFFLTIISRRNLIGKILSLREIIICKKFDAISQMNINNEE